MGASLGTQGPFVTGEGVETVDSHGFAAECLYYVGDFTSRFAKFCPISAGARRAPICFALLDPAKPPTG